jgi:hypothetical protein
VSQRPRGNNYVNRTRKATKSQGHKGLLVSSIKHVTRMTKKIIIPYFPIGLKYATPLFFGVGIYLLFKGYYILASISILSAIIILTTYYITEISMEHKRYVDYISLAGLRLGVESTTFNRLDRIVITKGNNSQQVNSQLHFRTMEWTEYTATLLFDNRKTLDLITNMDKSKLVKGIRQFAAFLEVRIEDRTGKESHWIN